MLLLDYSPDQLFTHQIANGTNPEFILSSFLELTVKKLGEIRPSP